MIYLTLFRMSLFKAAHGWAWEKGKKSPSLKSHTYPTMLKLGLVIYTLPKEDPENT